MKDNIHNLNKRAEIEFTTNRQKSKEKTNICYQHPLTWIFFGILIGIVFEFYYKTIVFTIPLIIFIKFAQWREQLVLVGTIIGMMRMYVEPDYFPNIIGIKAISCTVNKQMGPNTYHVSDVFIHDGQTKAKKRLRVHSDSPLPINKRIICVVLGYQDLCKILSHEECCIGNKNPNQDDLITHCSLRYGAKDEFCNNTNLPDQDRKICEPSPKPYDETNIRTDVDSYTNTRRILQSKKQNHIGNESNLLQQTQYTADIKNLSKSRLVNNANNTNVEKHRKKNCLEPDVLNLSKSYQTLTNRPQNQIIETDSVYSQTGPLKAQNEYLGQNGYTAIDKVCESHEKKAVEKDVHEVSQGRSLSESILTGKHENFDHNIHKAGLGQLLSLSGTHISGCYAVGYVLGRFILAPLIGYTPMQTIGNITGIIPLCFYLQTVEFKLSIVRSVVMLIFSILRMSSYVSCTSLAIYLLLVNPYFLFVGTFQISFIYVMTFILCPKKLSSLYAYLILLPYSLFYFSETTPMSIFTSIFIAPLFILCVVPLAFISSVIPAIKPDYAYEIFITMCSYVPDLRIMATLNSLGFVLGNIVIFAFWISQKQCFIILNVLICIICSKTKNFPKVCFGSGPNEVAFVTPRCVYTDHPEFGQKIAKKYFISKIDRMPDIYKKDGYYEICKYKMKFNTNRVFYGDILLNIKNISIDPNSGTIDSYETMREKDYIKRVFM